MAEQDDKGAIIPGSYNDAKISVDGDEIVIGQNGKMFFVLMVIALIIAAIIYFTIGSGEMRINDIPIPQPVAAIISIVMSVAFGLAALAAFLQGIVPGKLTLNTSNTSYKRYGGFIGMFFMKGDKTGSFKQFDKLVLEESSHQGNTSYRLTLHWKRGTGGDPCNCGSFIDKSIAVQIGNGLASKLELPFEQTKEIDYEGMDCDDVDEGEAQGDETNRN